MYEFLTFLGLNLDIKPFCQYLESNVSYYKKKTVKIKQETYLNEIFLEIINLVSSIYQSAGPVYSAFFIRSLSNYYSHISVIRPFYFSPA